MSRKKPGDGSLLALLARLHTTLESLLAVLAYSITAGILIVDVVARNVFQTAWLGTTSIAILCSVIAGFLGLSLATANRSHLRIEALDAFIGPPYRALADKAGHFLSACVFAGLAWFAFQFVRESARWGDLANDLKWPLWLFQTVIPWAFASTAIRHIFLMIDDKIYSNGNSQNDDTP